MKLIKDFKSSDDDDVSMKLSRSKMSTLTVSDTCTTEVDEGQSPQLGGGLRPSGPGIPMLLAALASKVCNDSDCLQFYAMFRWNANDISMSITEIEERRQGKAAKMREDDQCAARAPIWGLTLHFLNTARTCMYYCSPAWTNDMVVAMYGRSVVS
jgi:uncharacterized OsmC-like protein